MNTHAARDRKQLLFEEKAGSPREEVAQLLQDWNNGDSAARDRLVDYVYGDLLRMAHRRLQRERDGHTMQTGTLVHEVYVRLFAAADLPCRTREEFFGIVARQMRQVLVDAARKRGSQKRGRKPIHVPLEDAAVMSPEIDLDIIALDEALDSLAQRDRDLSRIVELHFFAGLSIEETANILGVSTHIVKRRWKKARIYLRLELTGTKAAGDGSMAMGAN